MGEGDLLDVDAKLRGRQVELAPHRPLQVGDHVAVLARGSTGWSLLSPTDYEIVKSRFGRGAVPYDGLWASEKDVALRLWGDGLIAVDGGVTAASLDNDVPSRATSVPSSLLLKLTGGCNFACTYCYDFDPVRFRANLSTTRAQEAIKYLLSRRHHLAITFHGGEPLLRFSLLREIVEYALAVAGDPKRLSFSIQTNASRMTDEIVAFLEHHNFSVGISIDGHLEAANRLRVVRRGRSALSYVKELLNARPEFVKRRCGFLMVVGRTSAPHICDFATWLQDNELRSLGFSFLDNEGAGRDLHPEHLEPAEVVEVWRSLLDAIRVGAIKELALTALISRVRNMFTLTPRDFCHRGPCGAASEFLVLDATGKFRTCDCVYHPYFEAGDSATPVERLLSVLRPAQGRILARHDRLATSEHGCGECAIFGLCGGTCVAKAIATNASPNSVDPCECAVSKYIYPLLLEEFASVEQPILSYFAYHQRLAGVSMHAE